MTYTDEQIRTDIESVITTAAPLAVVYPWWVLGLKEDMWVAAMRSPLDNDRVHAYTFTRTRSDGMEKSMRCVERQWSYDIWALHYYSTGKKTANTDLLFNAELDAITEAFDNVSGLPIRLQRRQPLQWSQDLGIYGGEMLHFAIGLLTVEVC